MNPPANILIIEDEADIASTLEYALKTEGFVTHWCFRGDHGLSHLSSSHVDLIVLDVGLPDGSGFELLKQIRTLQDNTVLKNTIKAIMPISFYTSVQYFIMLV